PRLHRSLSTVHSFLPCFFFSSRRRHTRSKRDWSSDVCSSDLPRGFCTAFGCFHQHSASLRKRVSWCCLAYFFTSIAPTWVFGTYRAIDLSRKRQLRRNVATKTIAQTHT